MEDLHEIANIHSVYLFFIITVYSRFLSHNSLFIVTGRFQCIEGLREK